MKGLRLSSIFGVLFLVAALSSPGSSASFVPPEGTTDEWNAIYEARDRGFDENLKHLRALEPERKRRYADLLRRYDPDRRWNEPGNSARWWDLLALGDEITGDYLLSQAEQYPERESILILANWHSAKALACAGRATLIKEDLPEATIHYGPSFAGVSTITVLLQALPAVPPSVKHWALGFAGEEKQMIEDLVAKRGGDRYLEFEREAMMRGREIMRAWWRENEKAVTEGRLQDLQPGAHYQSEFHRSAEPEPPARRISLSPASPAIPTPNAPPTGPTEGLEQNSQRSFWVWLVAGLVALVAATIWLRRKLTRGNRI